MNKDLIKSNLQNSITQYKSSNPLIGTWIRNETELAMAQTFSEKRIGDYEKEDMIGLVEVMAKWSVLLGMNANPTDTELVVICQFIYDEFKKFTLSDVRMCMHWAVSGKIDMTYISQKSISAIYVSKALQLYEQEKREIINRIALEKEKAQRALDRDKKMEISPEERANTFKSILIDLYTSYKEQGKFTDIGDFVYNWLRDNNILNPTKTDVQDALIYAEKKYRLEQMEKPLSLKPTSIKPKEDNTEELRKKKLAREYVITKLFDKVQMIDLIKLIKLEQFKK